MKILNENTILSLHTPSTARRVATIAAGLLLGVALCMECLPTRHSSGAIVGEAARKVSLKKPAGWHQIGLASWYGPQFQGKETANGETFNMHALTCAHRFLPLGTWVKVTNLHTHRWIVVRVNDRGPVPDTRIVDLSSEAARMLGMHAIGVTRIRLDVIDPRQAVKVARLDRIRQARLTAEADSIESGN